METDSITIIVLLVLAVICWVLIVSPRRALHEANRKLDIVTQQAIDLADQLEAKTQQSVDLGNQLEAMQDAVETSVIDVGSIEEPHIYATQLAEVKQQQKDMKSSNGATLHAPITFDGSLKKGDAIMKKVSKLVIGAFEGEVDKAIRDVKHNNITSVASKIQKSADKFGKMLAPNFTVTINSSFVKLKQQELQLYYKQALAKQAQKEAEAAFREELREQERAEKEHAANVKKAEAEAKAAQEAYDKATAAFSGKLNEADATIMALQAKLEEAMSNKERAISQAQLTRSGHIYVIKNTGAFGKDVYKVGMTRRLVPMDRVKELSGASVPFPFAVCAMFSTDDAPTLEKELHNALDEYRVNKVNKRKEFFNVSLETIVAEVKKRKADVNFTMSPEELEYEASQ